MEKQNIAFKCNYCDGGKSDQQIGFSGLCSDYMIKQNAKKTWCSSPNCSCSLYLNKYITYQDLQNQYEKGEFICYESSMLKDWQALAGRTRAEHKPKQLKQVKNNKICILTTREPQQKESQRYIFAVFLIDELFNGDNNKEGFVKNNSQWRLTLAPQEAHKILFWQYYSNNGKNQKEDWRTGLYRYFSDEQVIQILRDIITIKATQNEKVFAQNFLQHYCAINAINLDIN